MALNKDLIGVMGRALSKGYWERDRYYSQLDNLTNPYRLPASVRRKIAEEARTSTFSKTALDYVIGKDLVPEREASHYARELIREVKNISPIQRKRRSTPKK